MKPKAPRKDKPKPKEITGKAISKLSTVLINRVEYECVEITINLSDKKQNTIINYDRKL